MASANPHLSVSNEAKEAAADPKKAVFKVPSEGQNPKTNKVTADGIELVEGFKLRKEMTAAALAEVAQAPDTSELRDIGEASFGPPPVIAETVHGADDRVKINNTAIYPWRAHASLLITAADNSQWIGTGWFIGPHTLMTAGHVVYIKNSGVPGRDGWVKRIHVMPGRNGNALPYGSVTQHDVPLGQRLDQQRRPELRLRRDHPADTTSATRSAGSASASTTTPTSSPRSATSPAIRATSRAARSGTTRTGSRR